MENEIVYNKLVRDNIPSVIKNSGKEYVTHVASDKEYEDKLLKKLLEEANEFVESPCQEEIGDILEVIDALIVHYNFSMEQISRIKKEKAEERGGFRDKVILEKVILM